ncbi:hypothetical protein GOODEAATRI_019513 [Goodea atripinnis]|uniref:Uncharacterized protein n=1 Tax=Goodea atripinnis TaxID=208336 RepID=A0ABV0MJC2_9TELE
MARTRSLRSTLLHFSVSTLDGASNRNEISRRKTFTASHQKWQKPKKRKIASQCRKFQTRWESEYFNISFSPSQVSSNETQRKKNDEPVQLNIYVNKHFLY